MNTPAHLIVGLAAFGKPKQPLVIAAALLGALLPDLSLYLLAGWELWVRGTPPEVVFDELYFSALWQTIFRIDNSAVLWGVGLALALWARSGWAVALTGAALLHIATDLPLHHDDGRAHFWPITDWVFVSPVSYWDMDRYAGIVAPVEMAIVVGLAVWLVRRFEAPGLRFLILGLTLMQVLPVVVWMVLFDGGA